MEKLLKFKSGGWLLDLNLIYLNKGFLSRQKISPECTIELLNV